jgi:tRNA-specific 2-thiouridylase
VAGSAADPFRDFSKQYWDGVFAHFLAEYAVGPHAQPDVLCNRESSSSISSTPRMRSAPSASPPVHTGARPTMPGLRAAPVRRRRPHKDQSYFLHQLGQAKQLPATRYRSVT